MSAPHHRKESQLVRELDEGPNLALPPLRRHLCVRCNKTFTTRNKFNRLCPPCGKYAETVSTVWDDHPIHTR